MPDVRPMIGITMGDPVGIGPEIILSALCDPFIYKICRPVILGDTGILEFTKNTIHSRLEVRTIQKPAEGTCEFGKVNVISLSDIHPDTITWGKPTVGTGKAMVRYITSAIDLAIKGEIDAVTTCPINKKAMQKAGFNYNGHTELLSERTGSNNFAMMLAGDRLRVILVTIHVPLKKVPAILTKQNILNTIRITAGALKERFGIQSPKIAVAGLNPHAGESGMFGNEEIKIIGPSIHDAVKEGINAKGPFPPDTVFYHAIHNKYDAVIAMYHDQGLIPFKLIHFTDGVNTTLGLPIIRTSVDHGTAYDIAGTGTADSGSLKAAIQMAATQAVFLRKNGTKQS